MAAAAGNRERLASLLAAPLLLVTPFVVFARHNGYGLLRWETLLCVASLAGIGLALGAAMAVGGRAARVLGVALLAALLADVQLDRVGAAPLAAIFAAVALAGWVLRAHVAEIACTLGAALLVASLVLPSGGAALGRLALDDSPAPAGAPPPILHLVLDEQTGVEGIPRDFDRDGAEADRLRRFWTERGFRVYGRAYSRFYDTDVSLPNLVNFTRRARRPFEPGWGRVLGANAYFAEMTQRGYRIQIVQSDYIDFCHAAGEIALAGCFTYALDTLDAIEDAPLPRAEKLRVAVGMYASLSRVLALALDRVGAAIRAAGGRPPWGAPPVSPISAMRVLEQLISELPRIQPGSLVFVHLLLPHQPYAYDADCQLEPQAATWLRANVPPLAPRRNTPESRAARWSRYLAQGACLRAKLGELFRALQAAGVLDTARIVVHGDHGSRIGLFAPDVELEPSLTPVDYLDAFPTLFAVKEPGAAGGYERAQASTDELFGAWVRGELPALQPGEPWVFLRAPPPGLQRRPMPTFEDGRVGPLAPAARRP